MFWSILSLAVALVSLYALAAGGSIGWLCLCVLSCVAFAVSVSGDKNNSVKY